MKGLYLKLGLVSAIGLMLVGLTAAIPPATTETRLCGPPARHARGKIIRRANVLHEFERLYPRPQDGRRWYKDHVLPLACGGCDAVWNLQWLPEAQWREKSTWERRVYGGRGISTGCP